LLKSAKKNIDIVQSKSLISNVKFYLEGLENEEYTDASFIKTFQTTEGTII